MRNSSTTTSPGLMTRWAGSHRSPIYRAFKPRGSPRIRGPLNGSCTLRTSKLAVIMPDCPEDDSLGKSSRRVVVSPLLRACLRQPRTRPTGSAPLKHERYGALADAQEAPAFIRAATAHGWATEEPPVGSTSRRGLLSSSSAFGNGANTRQAGVSQGRRTTTACLLPERWGLFVGDSPLKRGRG